MQVFHRGIRFLLGLFLVPLTLGQWPTGVLEQEANRTYLEVLHSFVNIPPKAESGHPWVLVRRRNPNANRPLPLRPNETMTNPLYMLLGDVRSLNLYGPLPPRPNERKLPPWIPQASPNNPYRRIPLPPTPTEGRILFPRGPAPDPMRNLKPGVASPPRPRRGPATPTRSLSLFAHKQLPPMPRRSKSASNVRQR
uniref:Uncharacterized protein n=1 Tax=Rhipicephalus appendiculatus TaxID=34631 RepID=A0A131YF85_RHIAP